MAYGSKNFNDFHDNQLTKFHLPASPDIIRGMAFPLDYTTVVAL